MHYLRTLLNMLHFPSLEKTEKCRVGGMVGDMYKYKQHKLVKEVHKKRK